MDKPQGDKQSLQTDIDKFFSKTLARLESRMESVEVKVMSLSKIVRLLQQYSEKKDIQYQKQARNIQTMHEKLIKIEQLQHNLSNHLFRFNELTTLSQNNSLRLQQLSLSLQQRQLTITDTQDRLNYEIQQINTRLGKLQSGLLHQIREGSRKKQEDKIKFSKNEDIYSFEEINFRLGQFENNFKNDLDKIKSKVDRIQLQLKKYAKEEVNLYGLEQLNKQKQKNKAQDRKKSPSKLKRLKSK